MTKYSTQFKIKVVQEYLQGGISQYKLCKKYGMADKTIAQHWINLAREHGFESLAVKHTKKRYILGITLLALTSFANLVPPRVLGLMADQLDTGHISWGQYGLLILAVIASAIVLYILS